MARPEATCQMMEGRSEAGEVQIKWRRRKMMSSEEEEEHHHFSSWSAAPPLSPHFFFSTIVYLFVQDSSVKCQFESCQTENRQKNQTLPNKSIFTRVSCWSQGWGG